MSLKCSVSTNPNERAKKIKKQIRIWKSYASFHIAHHLSGAGSDEYGKKTKFLTPPAAA
jgi:3-methyladenine DNA glycosylase/8-oxoguanine DNA glycosylase